MKKKLGPILAFVTLAWILASANLTDLVPDIHSIGSIMGGKNDTPQYPNPQTGLEIPFLSPITPNPNPDGVIILNWSTCENASFYNIYRMNTTFTSYNSSILVGTTTQTNLTDWIRMNGTYYYGVTAVNQSIGESDLSPLESVTVELTPIIPGAPNLEFSRLVGGSGEEMIYNVAVDNASNSYVIGYTESPEIFICNAYNDTFAGGQIDAFVAKYSPTGAKLWETYLGGTSDDIGFDIAVDQNGDIVVVGFTNSSDFPVLNVDGGEYQADWDVFLAKFSGEGNLLWSRLFGGSQVDQAFAVTIDFENNIIITGRTNSANFPMVNASVPDKIGGFDIFVGKFNATGGLTWSTYQGGAYDDSGEGITVDGDGNCYITGYSYSTAIVWYYGYYYDRDVRIIKLNSTGGIEWNNVIAANQFDIGKDIAVGPNNKVYLTGFTFSTNFPTVNAYDSTNNGGYDGFITVIDLDGNLVWSTYLGGTEADGCYAIAVDSDGNCYVTGETYSSTFPVISGIQTTFGGLSDGFVIRFNAMGQLEFNSYLGGSLNDYGNGIAVDPVGKVYIGGATYSNNFPIQNVDHSNYSEGGDGFILCYPVIHLPPAPILQPITPPTSSTGEITITWTEVETVIDYTLYRSTTPIVNNSASLYAVGTFNTTTAFDAVPTTGTYYYAVKARNATGYSLYSNAQAVTVTDIKVYAPTLHPIDAILRINQSIQLTWNTSYRATDFNIYRSNHTITSLEDAEKVGTTSLTTFVDTPPALGQFYYVVTALFGTFESTKSNSEFVTVNDVPRIQATNLTFIEGIPLQYLEWQITDEVNNQPSLTFYLNGTMIETRTWDRNTTARMRVDHLQPGTYNATLQVNDGYGEIVNETVIIEVLPNTSPKLEIIGTQRQLVFANTSFTLRWNATDPEIYATHYILYRNGTQISNGTWESGVEIEFTREEAGLGQFLFELEITDGYNGVSTAQILIIVSLPQLDLDGDGMSNEFELLWGLDPFTDDSQADPDNDGLTNYQEFLYGTNPFDTDTDGDGISDWDEIIRYGTDPTNSDTDGDTFEDGVEIRWESNPLSKWSNPVTIILWWVGLIALIAITTPLAIRRYKKALYRFNGIYQELIQPGFIRNLPGALRTKKMPLFRMHAQIRLKQQGFHQLPGSQDWFSSTLWQALQQMQTLLKQQDFLAVAVQMTKTEYEILKIIGIAEQFLTEITHAINREIETLRFSNLNADLVKILRGFEQTPKKLGNAPAEAKSLFLELHDALVPHQQLLAMHIAIKQEIDAILARYRAGEWVTAAVDLTQLQHRIHTAEIPYQNSIKTYIDRMIANSTEFLAGVHESQITHLHSLLDQGKYELAIYSWLKYTQFKHPAPSDPRWQAELTEILTGWKKSFTGASGAIREKSEREMQWILKAFAELTGILDPIQAVYTELFDGSK
jgi:fibronectin type 3 domain-containing protein